MDSSDQRTTRAINIAVWGRAAPAGQSWTVGATRHPQGRKYQEDGATYFPVAHAGCPGVTIWWPYTLYNIYIYVYIHIYIYIYIFTYLQNKEKTNIYIYIFFYCMYINTYIKCICTYVYMFLFRMPLTAGLWHDSGFKNTCTCSGFSFLFLFPAKLHRLLI